MCVRASCMHHTLFTHFTRLYATNRILVGCPSAGQVSAFLKLSARYTPARQFGRRGVLFLCCPTHVCILHLAGAVCNVCFTAAACLACLSGAGSNAQRWLLHGDHTVALCTDSPLRFQGCITGWLHAAQTKVLGKGTWLLPSVKAGC